MKKLTKIFIIIASGLLGVGVILLLIGFIFGGVGALKTAVYDGNIPFAQIRKHYMNIDHWDDDWDENIDDWDENIDDWDYDLDEWSDDWDDWDEGIAEMQGEYTKEYEEGIHHRKETSLKHYHDGISIKDSWEFSSADISELELDVNRGEVYVIESQDAQIRVSSDRSGALKCVQENKELTIKRNKDFLHQDTAIYIEIPKDIIFDKIEVDMAAGLLCIDKISGKDVEVDMDAGFMEIENINAQGLEAKVNAGQMIVRGIAQNIEAKCNMGAMNIYLAEPQNNYNYKIRCAAGAIHLGEDSFSGLVSEKIINNNVKQNIELRCNMGEMEVKFGA